MSSKLRVKPQGDYKRKRPKFDNRIGFQEACLRAILDKTNFGIHCFLARVRSAQPYENYKIPEHEEFEFSLKGALRCEMIDRPGYQEWRRLFGTSKERKFPKGIKDAESLPTSWKSRVLLKVFKNEEEAQDFLDTCPLAKWEGLVECPLFSGLTLQKGQYVLLQIHDVNLGEGKTLATLLESFLKGDSEILTLVGRGHNCRLGGRNDERDCYSEV